MMVIRNINVIKEIYTHGDALYKFSSCEKRLWLSKDEWCSEGFRRVLADDCKSQEAIEAL